MLKRNTISFEVMTTRSGRILNKAVVEAPSMWRTYYLPTRKDVSGKKAALYDPALVQPLVNYRIHPDVAIGGFYENREQQDVRLSQGSVGGGPSTHESQGPDSPVGDVQVSREGEDAMNGDGRATRPENSDDEILSLESNSVDNDICDSHESEYAGSDDHVQSDWAEFNDTSSQVQRLEKGKQPLAPPVEEQFRVQARLSAAVESGAAAASAAATASVAALRALQTAKQRQEERRSRSTSWDQDLADPRLQVELDVNGADYVDGSQTQHDPPEVFSTQGGTDQDHAKEIAPETIVQVDELTASLPGSRSLCDVRVSPLVPSPRLEQDADATEALLEPEKVPPAHPGGDSRRDAVLPVAQMGTIADDSPTPRREIGNTLGGDGGTSSKTHGRGGELRGAGDGPRRDRDEVDGCCDNTAAGEYGKVSEQDLGEVGLEPLAAEIDRRLTGSSTAEAEMEVLAGNACAESSAPGSQIAGSPQSEREEARRAEKAWKTTKEANAKRKAAEKEAMAKEEEDFVKKFARPAPSRIFLKGDTSSDDDDDLTRGRLLRRYNCIWPQAGVRPVDRVGKTHVNQPTPPPRKPEQEPVPEPSLSMPTSSGSGNVGASFSFHTTMEDPARIDMKTELIEGQWMRKRKAEIDLELEERVNKKLQAAQEEMKAQHEAMIAKLYADIAAGRVQLPIPDPSSRHGNRSEIQSGVSNAASPFELPLPTPTPATPVVPDSEPLVSVACRVDPDIVHCTPDPLLLSQFDATHGM